VQTKKDLPFSNPHSIPLKELVTELGSNPKEGLSHTEARIRIQKYGPNKIENAPPKSVWLILFNQFKSPIVILLLVAAGVSLYLTEWADCIAIFLVMAINTGIGFYMEFQATISMEALKDLTAIKSNVLREKDLDQINSEEIVPGDIVFLEAGDLVPADGRIIKSSSLQIDESALTGESVPVEKEDKIFEADAILADRSNMLYKGTHSTRGNAYYIVTHTGINTELGKIAKMVQTSEQSSTPLEKKLEEFSKKLIWITIVLVLVILGIGFLQGKPFLEILKSSLALAVAAIPEGLPIVATVALSKGMLKMAKHKVIIKKLSAVETLGGTNIICTDKTGTLTENKIVVSSVLIPSESEETKETLLQIMVLCNNAEIEKKDHKAKEIGDPLEVGLLHYAHENKINIHQLRSKFHRIKEEPFSSETKIMATLNKTPHGKFVYAKGATEEILEASTSIIKDQGITTLSTADKKSLLKQAEDLSKEGFKVISAAYKENTSQGGHLTKDLIFVGLIALLDPPRKNVKEAVAECKSAGIKIIMITGDHPETAKNIALQIGIIDDNKAPVITGKEMKDFEHLSEKEKTNWMNTNVFARVDPKQKLDLVNVLQQKKNIVGMTGDGVNDAPALKKADIGIAMGIRGTQVSQEAADVVLKDDSFASIVVAIEQGRIIFENIRNFVIFLLSCNMSEIIVVATVSLMNKDFQLLPFQILFINLITDVLPALALGITPGREDIMKSPPRKMKESIINKFGWRIIIFYAFVLGGVSIGAVYLSQSVMHRNASPQIDNNILFYTLIFCQLLHTFNMSANPSNFFKSEVVRNKFVWGAILISVGILVLCHSIPLIANVLNLNSLTIYDWLLIIGASLFSLLIIQIGKKINIAKQ